MAPKPYAHSVSVSPGLAGADALTSGPRACITMGAAGPGGHFTCDAQKDSCLVTGVDHVHAVGDRIHLDLGHHCAAFFEPAALPERGYPHSVRTGSES